MHETVLIIDDEQAILDLLSRMLTDAGYRVQTAQTGQAAMDLAATNLFDMAIIDIYLPDMNGTDLLAKLKEVCSDMAMIIKRLRDDKRRLTADNRAYQGWLESMVKEKTAALEESEKTHRALVETMHEGVVVQEDLAEPQGGNETILLVDDAPPPLSNCTRCS